MATFPSKWSTNQRRHEEELQLVNELYVWLRPHAASLEIKPHPIGPPEHLEVLRDSHPGIVIHPYETSGPSGYSLNEKYNEDRLASLESADVVMGIWTTFLLDAALAGRSVGLVEFPDGTRWRALWSAQLGLHVQHLRKRVGAVVVASDEGISFGGGIASFDRWVDQAEVGGQTVRDWIEPDSSVEVMVESLLKDSEISARLAN